jgi:transposase
VGAPQASQVADRFHLILNLSAAIERVLEERSRELILPAVTPPVEAKLAPPASADKPNAPQQLKQQRRQRRMERYEQVTELRKQGYSKMAISRELSISVKTVRRWLRADQFPERKPPSGRRKKVAEFAAYLDERWKEGCHNSTQLFTEIRARGYKGSRQMVTSFVALWRHTGSRPSTATAPQRVAPKHAAILTAQAPEKFTPEQKTLFDRLVECCPDLLPIRRIALAFRDVFATADFAALLCWIQDTKRCRFGPLVRFAYGLQKDIAAVSAAVKTNWSNGQTEGQINRLKAIKRQMYGRAGFSYLRARVLPCPALAASATANPP